MKPFFLPILLFCSLVSVAQNVGIGNNDPASKLEINNNSSIRPSLGIVDSTTGGFGTIRLKNFARTNRFLEFEGLTFSPWARDSYLDVKSDSLVIATFNGAGNVGIGLLTPTDRLHVNGNINLTGTLKFNGSAGAAGQVLTSNGAGDPTWQTMRSNFPANGRLLIPLLLTAIPNKIEKNLDFAPALYNTFGGAITVGTNTITINETGLYEIEGKIFFYPGAVQIDVTGSFTHPFAHLKLLVDDGTPAALYQIYKKIEMISPLGGDANAFAELIPFKVTIQLTAGTVISFPANIDRYVGDRCCDPSVRVSEGYISLLRVD